MKTFIADIIPKIQRYSQQLDNITLLTNQHWVVIDGIQEGKSVYIFRPNGELIISTNGRVEKAKWDLLGKNSILVDMKNESYLFKHGFFDENVLALKIDGREEYAFLLNENRYSGELNSVENVIDYLTSAYFTSDVQDLKLSGASAQISVTSSKPATLQMSWRTYKCVNGNLEIETWKGDSYVAIGNKVRINGEPAPNRKYKIGFMWYVTTKNGVVVDVSLF